MQTEAHAGHIAFALLRRFLPFWSRLTFFPTALIVAVGSGIAQPSHAASASKIADMHAAVREAAGPSFVPRWIAERDELALHFFRIYPETTRGDV